MWQHTSGVALAGRCFADCQVLLVSWSVSLHVPQVTFTSKRPDSSTADTGKSWRPQVHLTLWEREAVRIPPLVSYYNNSLISNSLCFTWNKLFIYEDIIKLNTSVWRGLNSGKRRIGFVQFNCSSHVPIQANFHAVPGWWFAFQMSLKEIQCMSREQGHRPYSTSSNYTVIYWHYSQSNIDLRIKAEIWL